MSGPIDLDALLRSGCASGTAPTERVPLYMLFVLDGSGSMSQHGKWDAVVPALEAIFADMKGLADPSLGAGLTIFGDRNDLTISDNFAGPYDKMDVPVSFVNDAQLSRLRDRLDKTAPYLGTPTYEVLFGQYPLLRQFPPMAPLLPGGRRVLVFMTDGVPDPDMPAGQNEVPWSLDLARKQAEWQPTTDAINTFVVGVGPFPGKIAGVDYSPGFLASLAVAGGTRSSPTCDPDQDTQLDKLCYFQITPPDAGSPTPQEIDQLRQKFIDTINAIRGEATLCEYTLSRINANNGNQVDPANINVVYTDGSGKQSLVPRSTSAGWTYDDPKDPKKVILHGTPCDQIKSDPRGKITVVLGCKTVLG